jgi:FixJ family two-component response regulator
LVVIDDEPAVRRAMMRMLAKAGFHVAEREPPETLETVGEIADALKHADALVTDVVMPALNGVDVAQALRKLGCEAPIVLVSGYVASSLIEKARTIPRSTFLQKPFTAAELDEKLEPLLANEAEKSR